MGPPSGLLEGGEQCRLLGEGRYKGPGCIGEADPESPNCRSRSGGHGGLPPEPSGEGKGASVMAPPAGCLCAPSAPLCEEGIGSGANRIQQLGLEGRVATATGPGRSHPRQTLLSRPLLGVGTAGQRRPWRRKAPEDDEGRTMSWELQGAERGRASRAPGKQLPQ